MVNETTLHLRSHHINHGGSDGSHSDESKMDLNSSNFYRTHLRGFRWKTLLYCIVIAVTTFGLYYVVYWRDSSAGKGGALQNDLTGGDRHRDIGLDNVNPRFGNGIDKQVAIDRLYQGAGNADDKRGLNDAPRRKDFKHNRPDSAHQMERGAGNVIDHGDVHDGFDQDTLREQEADDDGDANDRDEDNKHDVDRVFLAAVMEEGDEEEEEEEVVIDVGPGFRHQPAHRLKDGNVAFNQGGRSGNLQHGGNKIHVRNPVKHKVDHPLAIPRAFEIDPDYRAVAEHNKIPGNKPKMPKFKPNKHINPNAQNLVLKPHPKPKEFPVTLLQAPNTRLCPRKQFVLMVVLSDVRDSVVRNTIRKTWGSPGNFHAPHIPEPATDWWVVFAVGSIGTTDDDVKVENAKFGDILQGDIFDIESEETRKMMMAMKWMHDLQDNFPACRPSYFLKTSSHVFVNGPLLSTWISKTLRQVNNVYAGKVLRQDSPIRDLADTHFVPYSDFQGEYFPDMVRGPTFFLSVDVVYRMVPLFATITPIAMDDSYVGILASHLDVKPRSDDHFVHLKRPSNVCHYTNMMLVYGLGPSEHRHVYNVIVGKSGRHCLNHGL